MTNAILRLPDVMDAFRRSRSAIYRDIEQGLFPVPISLGARAVGWPAYEVERLISARIAGKSEAEIRQLVSSLQEARKTAFEGAAQ